MKKRIKIALLSLFFTLIALFLPFVSYENAGASVATSAGGMAVIEKDSGRVIASKNANKKMPMASTTKIATAITVIERVKNLNEKIRIPKQAIGVEGSSIYLNDQDELSILDLLHGLMLQSGNDCAVALALTVGGSLAEFAKMMNETARTAGAENTNFVTPHGLHDDNHYTTALDLAKISAYAMKNPVFAKIVSTKKHTTSWGGRNYDRVIINKNKILSTYDGGDGIKTGFTKKAGRCLVSSATRNGMTIIAVTLNCGAMFEECRKLMDYAFDNYENYDLSKYLSLDKTATVIGGVENFVRLAPRGEINYPLTKSELSKLVIDINGVENMVAPVKNGQENGKIQFLLENRLLFERKLYTINGVEPLSPTNELEKIVERWNG
ncbi:MAG: D-alanyl-D-alanine carboxypeptidase [Clostridia bacterium]|nr:D-alanyl-D-alanine carboxypeptidase [Clostridia bacterium]